MHGVRTETGVRIEIRMEVRARMTVKVRIEVEWVPSIYLVEINKLQYKEKRKGNRTVEG
jgi:hypothetical protein